MSKKIMVVDDSAVIRQMVSATLNGAGYSVVEGCDGKDALGKLGSNKVDLIVSDVNMPYMDGIAMVKALRDLPGYKFVPVIMLTTESCDKLKARGKEAGVKAWMVKPMNDDKLLMAVSKLLPA